MKKPQIKIDINNKTKIYGYSFKECVDYIKLFYNISDKTYKDLIDWANPNLMEYPFTMWEKITDKISNPYEYIADGILNDLYLTTKVKHREEVIDSIEMLFIQFAINYDYPVVGFLEF